MEFTLLWAAATAAVAVWVGIRLLGSEAPVGGFELVLSAALAGLLGGRIVAMLAQGLNPVANPLDLLIVRGGVNTVAATATAIAALYLGSGRRIGDIDTMAPAILLGLAGWHSGCVWRDACLGTTSGLPWAMALDGSSLARHPVEIYAAVALVIAAIAVSRLPATPGLRSGAALALASAARLVTEPFRLSLGTGPAPWYTAGLGVGLLIVAASVVRARSGTVGPAAT